MNLRKVRKYRKFFGQEVFCTDEVMDSLSDLIKAESITKFSKFSDYITIFDDLVYPVLIKKSDENSFHFIITDTNNPASIREFSLKNSPTGGSISHFFKTEDGHSVEKNYSIFGNNLLYVQKQIDNIYISISYADGGLDPSIIYINIKSSDPSTGFITKNVDITLYEHISLEELEKSFMQKILDGFASDLFTIRSSILPFYDVISEFVTSFDVSIEQNKESLNFSFYKDKGFKLSAHLNTPDYSVAFLTKRKKNLNTLKKFYASFLTTNLDIIA